MEVARPTPSRHPDPPYRRRRIIAGLLAGLLAVGLVWGSTMLVRSLIRDDGPSASTASTSYAGATSVTVPARELTTTEAVPDDTGAPDVRLPLALNFDSPPPIVEPVVVATIQTTGAVTEFGVVRDGWVVLDDVASTATVYDRAGTVLRSFALDVVPSPFVVGPDDVLYGMTPPAAGVRAMVAIPLDGLGAGKVAAQTTIIGPDTYLDAPAGMLGTAAEGIVDRSRNVGAVLMPYLALDGTPITFADATFVTMDTTGTVSAAGSTWSLPITRAPGVPSPGTDLSSLVPSPTGAVYQTTLGAPTDASPDGTEPVIAVLSSDGTGQWSSLPEGWRLAAGNRSGTLLRRDTTVDSIPTVDVAWFP